VWEVSGIEGVAASRRGCDGAESPVGKGLRQSPGRTDGVIVGDAGAFAWIKEVAIAERWRRSEHIWRGEHRIDESKGWGPGVTSGQTRDLQIFCTTFLTGSMLRRFRWTFFSMKVFSHVTQ
jgi:hypothetical protein